MDGSQLGAVATSAVAIPATGAAIAGSSAGVDAVRIGPVVIGRTGSVHPVRIGPVVVRPVGGGNASRVVERDGDSIVVGDRVALSWDESK